MDGVKTGPNWVLLTSVAAVSVLFAFVLLNHAGINLLAQNQSSTLFSATLPCGPQTYCSATTLPASCSSTCPAVATGAACGPGNAYPDFTCSGQPSTTIPTTVTTTIPSSGGAGCTSLDPTVHDPSGEHGLYVYEDVRDSFTYQVSYGLDSPTSCGVTMVVPWNAIEPVNESPSLWNWNFIDNVLSAVQAQGKVLNLELGGVAQGNNHELNGVAGVNGGYANSTPMWVLKYLQGQTCTGSSVTGPCLINGNTGAYGCTNPDVTMPAYWNPGYYNNFIYFIQQVDAHYASNPSVGYIRFGFGAGGEDGPNSGVNGAACLTAFTDELGYTPSLWLAYENMMMTKLGGLPRLETVDLANPNAAYTGTNAIADGFGLAYFGLGANIPCTAEDYCNMFALSKLPNDMQPAACSFCGDPQQGYLDQSLPLMVPRDAQILELQPPDWMVAYQSGDNNCNGSCSTTTCPANTLWGIAAGPCDTVYQEALACASAQLGEPSGYSTSPYAPCPISSSPPPPPPPGGSYCSTGANALATAAARITGPLNTGPSGGTQLYTSSGTPICIYSVDLAGLVFGSGPSLASGGDACGQGWSPVSPQSVAALKAAGFNAARLTLSWANLEPTAPTVGAGGVLTHNWNMQYVAAVDSAISMLTSNGIAVILDSHQDDLSPAFKYPSSAGVNGRPEGDGVPAWFFPVTGSGPGCSQTGPSLLQKQGFMNFANNVIEAKSVTEAPWPGQAAMWAFITSRYAGNPLVIGADIFNEPYMFSDKYISNMNNLPTFYLALAAAVRKNAPNWLVIYESCQQGETASLSELQACPNTAAVSTNFKNTVYSYHIYVGASQPCSTATWISADATNINYEFSLAQSHGAPLWLGEWNIYLGDWSCISGASQYDAMLGPGYNLMATSGINWDLFSWEGEPTSPPYCGASFSSAICTDALTLAREYMGTP